MFVRCERCRAVYVLHASGAEPVVRCGRCAQMFVARSPLTNLSVLGTLGGAADPRLANFVPPEDRPAMAQPLRAPAPVAAAAPVVTEPAPAAERKVRMAHREAPEESGGAIPRGLVVALAAVLFAVGALAAWKLGPRAHGATALPPAVQEKVAAAQQLLLLDDQVDLESAIAAFDALAAQNPQEAEFVAARALATALLGATQRAEAADLNAELARLDHQIYAVREADPPDKADRVSQMQLEQADLRQRLGPVSERADKLLREAFELAKKATAQGDELADATRARLIVHAAKAEDEKAEAFARQLEPDDAWVEYARGLLKLQGIVTPAKAKEARAHFEAALAKNAELLRATWALGRAALYENDLDRAQKLFSDVLAKSPRHEGAQRGLALVASLRAPASAAVSGVDTAAP